LFRPDTGLESAVLPVLQGQEKKKIKAAFGTNPKDLAVAMMEY
jgi:hypothetical protein